MQSFLPPFVQRFVAMALDEDLGRGDVTTALVIPQGAVTEGRAVAKEEMVVSGLDVFAWAMRQVDDRIETEPVAQDGDAVAPGDILLRARGPAASLLMAERVALNFLQRLSGVATLTRRFVERVPANKTRITDTRKTTPGFGYLAKRAVRHGGGINHRVDLSGGILIKENHIAAAGSIGAAVERCIVAGPHTLRIEVEVRNLNELHQAVDAGADSVLLDNMTVHHIAECVAAAAGRVFIEVSGGVTLETVAGLAVDGVDAISVGALTHSAPSADISFLLENVTAP